ncbi:MAG: hypothetical protein D6744_11420 [Planctomycetota bacterium]|nr:MAG: hypothetical protein D6744_11420 [Planctomycetota bacterium]
MAGGELPALLRIVRRDGTVDDPEPMDLSTLEDEALIFADLTPADLNQLAEPWQLMEVISSDARFGVRRAAVKRLYESVDPERFIEYAHDRLPAERNPWVRSNLEYYRDLALGTPRDDAQRTPSSQAEFEYRQNPTAPEWAAVARFREQISESGTAATMLTALRTHLSNAPADLVIRRIAATELTEVAEEERAVVRDELLELLPHETDPSVRMYMAFALAFAAETGDAEVVGLLRSLAAVEPNILLVRPELEYLAWSIETGDEDPEHMTR